MVNSVAEIVEAAGGIPAAAALARVGVSAVYNWIDRGFIPADKFMLFDGVLRQGGQEANPSLFGFLRVEDARP